MMTEASTSNTAAPTAQPSTDSLGLGRTSGQRGAEIMAGFRAEKFPSPERLALSRWSGRITARLLLRMMRGDAPVNFLEARTRGYEALMRAGISPDAEDITFVEIACGFSPRGLLLARAFPKSQVVEIDLPDVVQDKQKRLQHAKGVSVPANMKWLSADLSVVPLAELLQGQLVDVVSAEGLCAYFTPEENTRISARILDSLKPGGAFICDLPWNEGVETVKQAAGFFSKQAGLFKGMVKSEDEARQPWLAAGYETVNVYRATQMIEAWKLPEPMADFAFLIECRKAKAEIGTPTE